MKRRSTRLEPEAGRAFMNKMRGYASELGAGRFTVSLEDAMHLWAEEETADYILKHRDHISSKKSQREFRKRLRNARMARLIDAAGYWRRPSDDPDGV